MSKNDLFPSSPEERLETQLLIEQLEEAVSSSDLLAHTPHELSVRGYQLDLGDNPVCQSYAIEYANQHLSSLSEPLYATSVDAEIVFPGDDITQGVASFTQHWTDGYAWTFSHTNDGPISYISQHDIVVSDPQLLHIDSTRHMLRYSGLPILSPAENQASDSERFETLLHALTHRCTKLTYRQRKELLADAYTRLSITHQSLIVGEPTHDPAERDIVQELVFELSHYQDFISDAARVLDIPTCFPTYSEHVVLRRDEAEASWRYAGSYEGPVKPSWSQEFQTDDSGVNILTRPKAAVISKILGTIDSSYIQPKPGHR